MARRFQRTPARVPVELVATEGMEQFEQPASIMDVSQAGLRIQTGPRLTPGQFLHVFLAGRARPFAHCRVVWSQSHGGALPSVAGLEIVGSSPWSASARLNLKALPARYGASA